MVSGLASVLRSSSEMQGARVVDRAPADSFGDLVAGVRPRAGWKASLPFDGLLRVKLGGVLLARPKMFSDFAIVRRGAHPVRLRAWRFGCARRPEGRERDDAREQTGPAHGCRTVPLNGGG